tara:strand:+ start:2844 stop:3854 length:1011 start_codon:yes stop_codon:yes gene_type:complete
MLIGRAPLRISFSGGGTDLEEYHKDFGGMSLSATINKYTFVIARKRKDKLFQGFSPDFSSHVSPRKLHKLKSMQGHEIIVTCLKEMKFKNGIDIFFGSEVEPASGLGTSSSLAANFVNVITKLQERHLSKTEIAMTAYRIGHDVLRWGIGKQDEFAAVYGGFNLLKFTKNNVVVEPLFLTKSTFNEFQNNSLLFHIGNRKHSSGILHKQLKNIKDRKPETMSALSLAKQFALEMNDALKQSDLTKFSEIMNNSWEQKKKFVNGISDQRIDNICKKIFSSGASAAKVTGAGGGGHIFVYAEKAKHNLIIQEMKKMNALKVDFRYQNSGARTMDIGDM